MELQKSIQFLKKRGYSINEASSEKIKEHIKADRWYSKQAAKHSKKEILYVVWYKDNCWGLYSGRELIKLARSFKGQGWKKFFKKHSQGQNRAHTRDKIKTEEFDNIPDDLITNEDKWNYT